MGAEASSDEVHVAPDLRQDLQIENELIGHIRATDSTSEVRREGATQLVGGFQISLNKRDSLELKHQLSFYTRA